MEMPSRTDRDQFSAGRPDAERVNRRLLERYGREPDSETRDALFERFRPLAEQLARRYQRGGEPIDDLKQVASIGLLNAIDRFDASHGASFSSFAYPTIVGELKRHFRDRGWSIRPPRDVQDLALRVERVSDELVQTVGRAPTVREIAEHLGVSAEQVLEAREAAGVHRLLSLDQSFDGADDGDGLAETVGREEPGYRRAESAATIDQLACELSARDCEVLRLRFVEDLTQSQIGARLGISQMHVSRLLRKALTQLRAVADRDGERAAA